MKKVNIFFLILLICKLSKGDQEMNIILDNDPEPKDINNEGLTLKARSPQNGYLTFEVKVEKEIAEIISTEFNAPLYCINPVDVDSFHCNDSKSITHLVNETSFEDEKYYITYASTIEIKKDEFGILKYKKLPKDFKVTVIAYFMSKSLAIAMSILLE